MQKGNLAAERGWIHVRLALGHFLIGDGCAPERHRAFSQIQEEVETPHLVEVGRSPTRAAISLSPCCLGEPASPLRLPVGERESKEPNNRMAPWRESEREMRRVTVIG